MKNFSREPNGYSPREVDEYLQRIKLENETRAREQSDRMLKMDKELKNYRRQKEMLNRALKITSEIEKSARKVYDLEVQKVQLLYRKWESMLSSLKSRFGAAIPTAEMDNIMDDFKYDMTITLESKKTPTGGRTYSQSILEKMQHTPNRTDDDDEEPEQETGFKLSGITFEYDAEGNPVGGNFSQMDGFNTETSDELSPAQRFISGENIELPASYGALVDNEYIVPPKEFRDALKETKKGFNIKDALSPRDSLESILRALDIDGDETQEHGKLIKGRDKKTAQTA